MKEVKEIFLVYYLEKVKISAKSKAKMLKKFEKELPKVKF